MLDLVVLVANLRSKGQTFLFFAKKSQSFLPYAINYPNFGINIRKDFLMKTLKCL